MRKKELLGAVAYFARTVAEGSATPADARWLLEEFVRQADSGQPIPPELIKHTRDCFAAYLAAVKPDAKVDAKAAAKLTKAFGLVAKASRPQFAYQVSIDLAALVLEHRLAGMSVEKAIGAVADAKGFDDTRVKTAWGTHGTEALLGLRATRALDRIQFTPDEIKRLRQIFKRKPNARIPGKSVKFLTST